MEGAFPLRGMLDLMLRDIVELRGRKSDNDEEDGNESEDRSQWHWKASIEYGKREKMGKLRRNMG